MKKYYFLVAFAVVVNYCDAQSDRVIDSLKTILQYSKGADRYPILHRLAVQYVGRDDDMALAFICKAELAALLSQDSLSIVRSRRAKGQILFLLGRTREVLVNNEWPIGVARRHKFLDELIYLTNATGASYTAHGKYDQALKYFFETYEICKRLKSTVNTAMVLENIGVVYYKLKDYRKGLSYLQSSFSINDSLGTVSTATPMNMSLCYLYLGDIQTGQRYLDMSKKVCGDNCDAAQTMHIKYAQGCIFREAREAKKAEDEFRDSYSLASELGDVRMQLDNIYCLVRVQLQQNRLQAAGQLLEEAEKLIHRGVSNNPEMIKIYKQFSELHLSLHNYREATSYQNRYIALRDSIYDEEFTANLVKIESEFLERDNRAKLTAQAEIIMLKDEVIHRQRLLNLAVGCLAFILLVFFFFLYRTYRDKKSLNVLLDRKVRERTAELEANRDAFARAAMERRLEMEQQWKVLLQNIGRIEALSATAQRESAGRRIYGYLEKIGNTVLDLKKAIRRLRQ